MTTLTVFQKRSGPIKGRHPWVFSGAIKSIPEGLMPGEPIKLIDEVGTFLAHGYFSSYSQIAVRLWSWDTEEEINQNFFTKRIRQAHELRERFLNSPDLNAYRLVYGENDLLPGLIVDQYADYISIQFHTKGIERWKKEIVSALVEIINPKGIYERSDVSVRSRDEELPSVGLLYGEIPDRIEIVENGLKFLVDIKEGQKTGFFLDQRDKRHALQKYMAGKNILNCFSYTGGFSVYARAAGAKRVVSVDASESAILMAKENMKLNGFEMSSEDFVVSDVKKYLASVEKNEFDVIILDPPAFVKDRRKVKEGLVGYRTINEAALRLLPAGGILVTASCSAHVSLQDFRFMLSEAAARAGRTVRIIETYLHGIDHPELVAFTEGEYLKCLFAIVE